MQTTPFTPKRKKKTNFCFMHLCTIVALFFVGFFFFGLVTSDNELKHTTCNLSYQACAEVCAEECSVSFMVCNNSSAIWKSWTLYVFFFFSFLFLFLKILPLFSGWTHHFSSLFYGTVWLLKLLLCSGGFHLYTLHFLTSNKIQSLSVICTNTGLSDIIDGCSMYHGKTLRIGFRAKPVVFWFSLLSRRSSNTTCRFLFWYI